MKEEEEEVSEAMEKDDPVIHAPGLNMPETEVDFAVAQAKEMTEQEAILNSIRDEAEVKANRRLIRQRKAEAYALYSDLKLDIATEEAAAEAPDGP
ncbi:Cysteinyl-tRNA synthetase [Hordeum vulgare]|nr:Cysteinyl-tRNA synthetase [Hordeum vulgare]